MQVPQTDEARIRSLTFRALAHGTAVLASLFAIVGLIAFVWIMLTADPPTGPLAAALQPTVATPIMTSLVFFTGAYAAVHLARRET